MRPNRIFPPELAKALASCGHTDIILVTDAGFPIPKDANRIDVGLYEGMADVLDKSHHSLRFFECVVQLCAYPQH